MKDSRCPICNKRIDLAEQVFVEIILTSHTKGEHRFSGLTCNSCRNMIHVARKRITTELQYITDCAQKLKQQQEEK